MNEQFVNEPNEKPRILIVDNNSQFARSARLLLDQSGKYVACTVIDPRRALETGRSFKPDLVLVDLIMPQEDGIEVAAQLEADWALHGVPIVFRDDADYARGSARWSAHQRPSHCGKAGA
jgi:CheY-like chemotaxis protein